MGAFVGRSEELRVLERAVADATSGRPRIVLVTGEAGIGKTALVAEVARRAETSGARVAIGRTWDGAGAPSFWLWRECLRTLGQALDLPDGGGGGDDSRFAAIASIAERIRDAARERPLVVVLDDVQWADLPSLHALVLLCRTARTEHLCIFGTVREPSESTEEAQRILASVRREATVLGLGGLAHQDLAELAKASGVEGDAAVAALARATSGNTLFAVEILEDRDARSAIDEGRSVPAPRGVRDVLDRHLARLAERDREVVEWAATYGTPIDAAAIAAAASLSGATVAAAIDIACRERILARDGGTLRFARDLFRDAAYVALPAARRIEMHLAFARVLGERDPTLLGRMRHLFAAHPDDATEEVADAALAAASAAIARLGYEDAANVAQRAAEIYERCGKRAETAKAKAVLAEALVLLGDVEGSKNASEQAVTLARDTTDAVAFARAALALGLRRVAGTSNTELVAALDLAAKRLEEARNDDVALRCAVEARLAAALQPMIDPQRALDTARRAIVRARRTMDPVVLARTLHAARPAFRMLESLDERSGIDQELVGLAERLGDLPLLAHARTRVFWSNLERGDAMAADFALVMLEDLAAKLRMPSHELGARMARCIREMMQGDFAGAQAKLDEIEATRERWTPALGMSWPIDPADMMRMNMSVLRGEAVEPPRGSPPPIHVMLSLFGSSRAGLINDTTRATFERTSGIFIQGEVWYMTRVILGDVCARLRATDHAARFYDLCLPFEGRHIVWTPLPGYDGAADRLLGALANVMGDRDKALRHYDAAIAMEANLNAIPFVERSMKERAEIAPVSVRVRATPPSTPSFVREGETWLVTFGDESTRMKDADGLRYLAYLISRPRVPVPVVELFAERANATADAAPISTSGDAGEVLDREAIASYRARARDLKEDLDEAEARNDRGAAEKARSELAFLEQELSRGVGLGGRSRRASSDHERIRVNVTTRIRKTIDKLRADAPRLASHLEASIKTGTTCSYEPVTP
jgi:tetratricopeptide (TPR) repeat protein